RTQSIYSDLGFILLGFILEDANRASLARQFERLAEDFRLKPEATGSRRRDPAEDFRLKPEATGSRRRDPAEDFRLKPEAAGSQEAVAGSRGGDPGSFRLQAEETIAFNPPREWRERTAPTELDLWRGRLLQGEVHDENTWALGGAAGHTGLFGTAAAVGAFAREILRGLTGSEPAPLGVRRGTLARFVRKSTVPGSSRALAWDTM